MTKKLSLLLAATILAPLLTCCSAVRGTDSNITRTTEANTVTEKNIIQVMAWGDESDMKKNIDAFYDAYPDEKDRFDIQVSIGGKGNSEVVEKFRLALASQNGIPDIVEFNRSDIIEFAEAGVLADVSASYRPYKADVTDSALQLVSFGSKLIGFPYEVKTKLWFYRKDIFDAAGIDPATVRNLDEFILAGKKLHEKFPRSYIWNIGPQMGSSATYNIGMILSGNGARFIDNAGNYTVAADPGVRSAFEALKKIKDSGITAPINDWTPDWEKAFADGTIVSSLCGNWLKFFLPKYAKEQAGKWAVTQFPEIGGAQGGSEAGGSLFVVPEEAKGKAAAMEFLSKLLLTKQGNLAMRKQVGHEAWVVMLKDTTLNPSSQQPDPFFGASLAREEAKAASNFKIFDFTPASGTEFIIVNQYLDKYLDGSLSLDDALKGAENDLKNQVGNPLMK